ncbi:uncharacterized protein LOC143229054 isoform X2 [Tachypleus tridentatus]|uniref:uncharacterized protein LOC143229054 isoform X2 n=1 Tax=Tachypleus tridentatus TaxID=6853 RepID=UPI003FD672D0
MLHNGFIVIKLLILSGILRYDFASVTDDSQPVCTENILQKCADCPAGTFGNLTLDICGCCPFDGQCAGIEYCTRCPAGLFQNETKSTFCIPCPTGTACNSTGCTSCDTCSSGSYSSVPGSSVCVPCSLGFYQPEEGSSECLKCPLGKETFDIGQRDCMYCPRGRFKNDSMTLCYPCPAGQETKEEGRYNCTLCSPGYYKEEEGDYICYPCDIGTYTLLHGSTGCTSCPSGFYCPCIRCAPAPCPEDAVCPQRSYKPTFCSSPFFVRQGYECFMADALVGIIISATLLVVLSIVIISAKFYVRQLRRRGMTDDGSLVQDTSTEPVYTGL